MSRAAIEDGTAARHDPVQAAGWLLALGEDEFRRFVSDDVKVRLDDEGALALRHPDVLVRWKDMLGILIVDVETQLAEKAGDRSSEVIAWRAKATRYRERLLTRRAEAKRRLSERNAAIRDEASRATREKKARRTAAGDRAIERLIGRHPDEFARLFREESARGNPGDLPDRVLPLVAAGLTVRAACKFASGPWPRGEIAADVVVEVSDG